MQAKIFKAVPVLILSAGFALFANFSLADSMDPARAIEVFTIAGMPPQNMPDNAVLIEIDEAGRLDAYLSEELPGDPEEAVAYMQNVMRSTQWQAFSQKLEHAYTGLARAKQLGIEKVPAIVIDSRYVVYGITDVDHAVRAFNDFHRE